MIKVLMAWRDNPNRTVEECDAYYLGEHTRASVASLSKAPGFLAYIQNRVTAARAHDFDAVEDRPAEPLFNRMVEIYFDSRENYEKATSANPEQMRAVHATHHLYMDVNIPASIIVYELEEVVALQCGALPSRSL